MKSIKEQTGEVTKIRKFRGTLIITCISEGQAAEAIKVNNIGGTPVIMTKRNSSPQTSKGVIHKVDKTIPEQDLLEVLQEQTVVAVKRFKKRINGELEPTPLVLITFNTPTTPKHNNNTQSMTSILR